MKIAVIVGFDISLINFRLDMMKSFIADGHSVVALCPLHNAEVRTVLENAGIAVENIRLDRASVNPFSNILTLLDIRKILQKHKVDTTINFTAKPLVFGSYAAKLAGVKNINSVVTGLGYSFVQNSSLKRKILKIAVSAMYKLALSLNRHVMIQNRDHKKFLEDAGIVSKAKTSIIMGSGVNMERFKVSPLPQKASFIFVGRLLIEKGIREYVKAAHNLKKKYPEAEFHIVGGWDENPSCISPSEIESLKNDKAIFYHGLQKDVRPFLNAASVCVLPSYSEGLPRSVLEAMALGRAVVVADSEGCRETVFFGDSPWVSRPYDADVVEGVNGFLAQVRNAEALEKAMEKLILSPDLRNKMGRCSFELVEKYFDVNKVNKVILNTLKLR